MVIVEFPHFTKAITALMPDDEYRQLQTTLIENPALGDLIQGTGGLRKLRGLCQVGGNVVGFG